MSQESDSPPLYVHPEEQLSEGEEAEDNSFETVAEALRLQWSVIGVCCLC